MNYPQALVFGLLQGMTEFLPVSSSGHLVVLKVLFGLREVPRLFDVVLHVATLLVVFVVFRRKILELLGAILRFVRGRRRPEDAPLLAFVRVIITATVFTGVIGLLIKDSGAENHPRLVSALFIVTAVLLVAAGRRSAGAGGRPGLKEAVIVGIAQGVGVLPGISRSGITISAALLAGMDRREAGEFSFLLAIPAILGAFILTLKDAGELAAVVAPGPLAAGFIAAFAAGYAALRILLGLVRGGRLGWFALYLVPLGLWGLFFL